MRPVETLKNQSDFNRIYHQKRSVADKYFIIYVCENESDSIRIGISVSKRVGNSVVRHRITRLVRESMRLNQKRIRLGYDLIIVARPMVKNKGYRDVSGSLMHILCMQGLVKDINQVE